MWYFSWVLGVGLAVGFGILNGIWHEFQSDGTDETSVLD
ncbi:cyd operon protein YbgT [Altererythrobacter atlanticus]|uniref:Cytochrome bd ubiquinol oxidase subunit X n=1 Tax=Croceibacterium atlanticum TaxID=1267766 RepID=A0A0F7KTA1_9SPHN|nr:cytochrome bd-I oxidase subunit CydX [Croceibacterium atlanticum]AKH42829.1 Cytochrome bd ubiquinol oxidase subunit X [Croceibacterium atlanticum]MBB5731609.1 cyd operon protein YbgT [Croceibacterium atlanticum]